jgi:hypothetical protein
MSLPIPIERKISQKIVHYWKIPNSDYKAIYINYLQFFSIITVSTERSDSCETIYDK